MNSDWRKTNNNTGQLTGNRFNQECWRFQKPRNSVFSFLPCLVEQSKTHFPLNMKLIIKLLICLLIHIYVCVYMYMSMYIYIYQIMHKHNICIFICLYIYTFTKLCTSIIYLCMYMLIHIHIHICVCVYVCVSKQMNKCCKNKIINGFYCKFNTSTVVNKREILLCCRRSAKQYFRLQKMAVWTSGVKWQQKALCLNAFIFLINRTDGSLPKVQDHFSFHTCSYWLP